MNSTTSSPIPSPKRASLLINRDFGLLWFGQSLSLFGDYVYDIALVLWMYTIIAKNQPWAPLAVSGIFLMTFLTTLVVGPLAGVFVDRWDKRRTMLRMDALRAVLIALLVLATGAIPLPFLPDGHLPLLWQLAAIYTIVLLAGTCAQFFNPARMTLIADIVPDAQRPHAVSLNQTVMFLATIVGPPLGALLFFGIGVQWTLWINALSFVASFLTVLAIHAPKAATSVQQGERGNVRREFGEGVRFVATNRFLATQIIVGVVLMFGAAPINTLSVFFLTENLHTSANLLGYLDAIFGIGAIIGALVASVVVPRTGLVRSLNLALLMGGILLVAFARMTSFPWALAISFAFGICQAGINVAMGPLMMRVTPRALLGRVVSLLNPSVALATVAGTAVAGYLASTVLLHFHLTVLGITFGRMDTIFMAGGIICVLGAVYALFRLGFKDPEVLPTPVAAVVTPTGTAPELMSVGSE